MELPSLHLLRKEPLPGASWASGSGQSTARLALGQPSWVSDITALSLGVSGGGRAICFSHGTFEKALCTPKSTLQTLASSLTYSRYSGLAFLPCSSVQNHLLEWKLLPCCGWGLAWPISQAFIKLLVYALGWSVETNSVHCSGVGTSSLSDRGTGKPWGLLLPAPFQRTCYGAQLADCPRLPHPQDPLCIHQLPGRILASG